MRPDNAEMEIAFWFHSDAEAVGTGTWTSIYGLPMAKPETYIADTPMELVFSVIAQNLPYIGTWLPDTVDIPLEWGYWPRSEGDRAPWRVWTPWTGPSNFVVGRTLFDALAEAVWNFRRGEEWVANFHHEGQKIAWDYRERRRRMAENPEGHDYEPWIQGPADQCCWCLRPAADHLAVSV